MFYMIINFLHTFNPESALVSFGPITIYWYGFFIVCAVLIALALTVRLSKKLGLNQEMIINLSFWLIIGAVLGARIYHVLVQLPFYLANPKEIMLIWHGGLAIHGAVLAGVFIVFYFARLRQLNFWKLGMAIVPGLALGQAIGRWGNYFNQELFGLPTSLPWGIPIDLAYRPAEHLNQPYFHPVFLYESLGNLLIFIILFLFCLYITKKIKVESFKTIYCSLGVIGYAMMYSLLRFNLEFIRLDPTPKIFGLRFPQWVSLIIFIVGLVWLLLNFKKSDKNKVVL